MRLTTGTSRETELCPPLGEHGIPSTKRASPYKGDGRITDPRLNRHRLLHCFLLPHFLLQQSKARQHALGRERDDPSGRGRAAPQIHRSGIHIHGLARSRSTEDQLVEFLVSPGDGGTSRRGDWGRGKDGRLEGGRWRTANCSGTCS